MPRQLHAALPAALVASSVALAAFLGAHWGLYPPAARSAFVPLAAANLLLAAVLAWRLTRSESELAAERERTGKVIEAAQSGIVDLAIDKGPNTYSELAKEILGYPRDADTRAWPSMVERVHPVEQPAVREALIALAKSNRRFDQDFRVQRADGTYCWLNVVGVCSRDAAGRATRFVGALLDVSERKFAQQRLELVVRAGQSGIIDWDARTMRAWYSGRFKEMLGYALDADTSGWPDFFDMIHPEDKPRVYGAFVFHLKGKYTGAPESLHEAIEYRLRRIDGSYMWVQGMGISLRDDAGKATRFIAALTDIAERRAQQEALRDQAALTRALIDSNPNPIYLKDDQCRFVDVNPAWQMQTGISAEKAMGRTVMDLFPSERSAVYDAQDRELLAKGEGSSSVEVDVLRVDGRTYNYIMSKSILKWADGSVRGLVGTITDITAHKETERQLRASREEALQAGQAKAAFLATMSHEIRTPLNGVLGMASLLKDTPLDPEQRDYVETILVSGDALLAVINDILDYSKIESGRMAFEREPLSVVRLVEESIEILGERARAKGLELLAEVDDGAPEWILGDLARLRQVLVNLVGNAVKFTQAGEIVVSVRTLEGSEGPMGLRFEVADTGIGIPAERLGNLFEAFTQVDASTTRKYGGTGLGLAICQRLVRMMGGELQVRSTPGKGSAFSFDVPAPVAQPVEEPAVNRALDIAGRRILIVDDNATNLRILSRQLDRWGAKAVAVADGEAALERIADERFDCAILDYHMPVLDGVELARRIRAHPKGKFLPLVLLSSSMYRRAEGAEKGLFFSQLLKPARQGQLLAAVAGAIAGVTDDSLRTRPIAPGKGIALADRHPLSILVADDVEVNRKLAVLMLKALGYTAQSVRNGREALEAAQRNDYDLILMDVQMPDMDGFAATRAITDSLGDARPKIVGVTAYAMASDRDNCLAAGMDDYLAKPFTSKTLADVILRVSRTLQGPGATGAAKADGEAPPKDAAPATDHPIDWTRLDSLRPYDADGSLVREAIGAFARDGPKYLAAMFDALSAANRDALASAAHALKGAAGNVGARNLEAACREVETLARAEQLPRAAKAVSNCAREIKRAVRALKK